MLTLGSTSIRRKLMLVLLLTSSSALLISAVGFTISDWYSQQNSMLERLRAVAGIIGSNSEAALTFQDPDSAQRTLSILKEEADIVSACLFTEQETLFASYLRDGGSLPLALPDVEENKELDGSFLIWL